MTSADNVRRSAPATLRNRDPILDVLRTVLPAKGLVLELASGSGEHVTHFARYLPTLEWQPSDTAPDARRSIAAWTEFDGLTNVREPLNIDAADDFWPIDHVAAIICINMVHISPWPSSIGLMRGSGRILSTGEPLFLYGPYRRADQPLEPSNEAFDRDLRARDPRWGLRDLEEMVCCATNYGLNFDRLVEMPAKNLSVIFRKG